MNGFNFVAIGVAIIAALVASALYYGLFLEKREVLSLVPNPEAKRKPKNKLLAAEMVCNIVLAFVLAYLITQLHVATVIDALWLSVLLWAAFPAMVFTGTVMYEKFPRNLALVHLGDWAIKLPVMILIMTLWR